MIIDPPGPLVKLGSRPVSVPEIVDYILTRNYFPHGCVCTDTR